MSGFKAAAMASNHSSPDGSVDDMLDKLDEMDKLDEKDELDERGMLDKLDEMEILDEMDKLKLLVGEAKFD